MTVDGLSADLRLRRGGLDLDVRLDVAPGRTVALLGPNGAGKSTTLGLISGSIALDDASLDSVERCRVSLGGHVLLDHDDGVDLPSQRRRVGVVFQDHLLFDHLDVIDNVAFGARCAGASRAESRRLAAPWLSRFDLDDLARRRPCELSGGQAQRVAIARTLAAGPAALLFDEPLAALDVVTRRDLRRELRRHLDEVEVPRVLITHDPTDAFVLADEVVVIEEGRVTQRGTPDDIRRHPTTHYVATLAGTNLLRGVAERGSVRLDGLDATLTVADTSLAGPVIATIRPRTITLHTERPAGSQRNVWSTRVELVERLGDIVRVSLEAPLPVSADVTPGAVEALGLEPGLDVWAAVKATEIDIAPT